MEEQQKWQGLLIVDCCGDGDGDGAMVIDGDGAMVIDGDGAMVIDGDGDGGSGRGGNSNKRGRDVVCCVVVDCGGIVCGTTVVLEVLPWWIVASFFQIHVTLQN